MVILLIYINTFSIAIVSSVFLSQMFIDFWSYQNGIEKYSLTNVRMFYALSKDGNCKDGVELLKEAINIKNWALLQTRVSELESNIERIYRSFMNDLINKIGSQCEVLIDEKYKRDEYYIIWNKIGFKNFYSDDSYKALISYGFGYLGGDVDFNMWNETQRAFIRGKQYNKILNSIDNLKYKLFKSITIEDDYNTLLALLKNPEMKEFYDQINEIKNMMELAKEERKNFIKYFDEIYFGALTTNEKKWKNTKELFKESLK